MGYQGISAVEKCWWKTMRTSSPRRREGQHRRTCCCWDVDAS